MKKKNNFLTVILLLSVWLYLPVNITAQVTVGADSKPQVFSVLELISNQKAGLRLPHLTTGERNTMEGTDEFKKEKGGEAKGLTIFNIDTNCVETWNGVKWISVCESDAQLSLLDCSGLAMTVTKDVAVDESKTLTYAMGIGNINLPNGDLLGSAYGLSVRVNGDQVLTSSGSTINVKITGASTTADNFLLPVNVGGQTCFASITSNAPSLTTLECSGASLTVVKDVAVDVSKTLSYTMGAGSISLADGTALGDAYGLSVTVNGDQTLTSSGSSINVKITGASTSSTNFTIPITIGGESCSISITSSDPSLTTFDCSGAALTVVKDVAVDVSKTLSYTMGLGSISLTDGASLGSFNGLTVTVDGNQTLTSSGSTINIKIAGASTSSANFTIPVTIGGQSCTISITSSDPSFTTFDCSGAALTVIKGDPVNINKTLSYTMGAGSISLTNGATLGNSNGLTVTVNGDQTLTSSGSSINITIAGTSTSSSGFTIPITIGGQSCNITVTSSEPSFTTFDCSGAALTVIKGDPVNINKTLSYTMGAGSISLTNGTALGNSNGLAVTVNGNQTLTSSGSTISITIAGTSTSSVGFSIPISIGGQNCNITVTSSEASLTTFDCSGAALTVVKGDAVSTNKTLSYSMGAGSISLTSGTTLGSFNGLTVTVNGNQTLTSSGSSISITIAGTSTSSSNFTIPVSIGGQSCNISVTSSEPSLSTFNCSGAAITVVKDVATTQNKTLSYTMTGAGTINLANGATLGSNNGLTVTVRGAQALTSSGSTIDITIAGTSTSSSNFTIPVTIGGQSCSISITSSAPSLSTINCSGAALKVGTGSATSASKTISYTMMGAGSISLTNGATLGSANGLSVTVNGAQSLTSSGSSINVTISGTTSATSAFTIPITVGGQSCSVAITIGLIIDGVELNDDLLTNRRYSHIYDSSYTTLCPTGYRKPQTRAEAVAIAKSAGATNNQTWVGAGKNETYSGLTCGGNPLPSWATNIDVQVVNSSDVVSYTTASYHQCQGSDSAEVPIWIHTRCVKE